MKLRPYQQQLESEIWQAWERPGVRVVLAVLPTGGGKCLGRGTPVLMHDGTVKPVEEVIVGDLIMGPDGGSRKVVSLARGRAMMYRISPRKGEPYTVNEDHILSLKRTGIKSNPLYPSQIGGQIVNISVRGYLAKSATFKHEHKGWRVGVDFPNRLDPLRLDPYFLGMWLGDGTSANPEITTGDREVVDFLSEYADHLELRLVVKGCGNRNCETVALSGSKGLRSLLREAFLSYGLMPAKFIPHEYKTSSRSERLRLLAGIMDSDGSYTGKGYDLVLKNEKLMDDVVFVARSLGFSAYKTECQKTCFNNGKVGTYWRCNISGDVDAIPCLIERKKARPRTQKKDVLMTGISVESIGVDDYFGFEIDGDRLFLLGDFTVTHNSAILSTVVRKFPQPAVVMAHRREIIGQLSLALAREGVRHRIIGPPNLIKLCVSAHMEDLRRSWYDPNARVAVASVQSISEKTVDAAWAAQVGLWVGDEFHHYVRDNEFGRALKFFPNARGLGVTATPCRADGQGLGSHADGVADAMVQGPCGRDLIEAGFLSRYKLFAPPSTLHREDIPVTAGGDFSPTKLREETGRSSVTGDVVAHYVKHAAGKLGLTFADSVENAVVIAGKFRDAGVRAEVLTGKSPDEVRTSILRQFKQRQVMQIVSVALIDEGFDAPSVECVSDAAATESFGRFSQRFGRGLRILDGKSHMLYFDHVGNLVRHGNPTAPRPWTLDRRAKRSASEDDALPLRVCANGNTHDGAPVVQGLATTPGEWAGWSRKMGDGIRAMTSVPDDGAPVWLYRGTGQACAERYERFLKVCPYCQHQPEPQARTSPEFVDGDLTELDDETLARLRGETIDLTAPPPDLHFLGAAAQGGAIKNHNRRADAQQQLRDLIALWAGWQGSLGRDDSYAYRLFFHTYGRDVLGAQALGGPDALALAIRLRADLDANGVTEA